MIDRALEVLRLREHGDRRGAAEDSATALQRAQALPAGARIVTTVCDSGLKYLTGDLYRE